MEPVEIDGRLIGPGFAPYVIAEMSGNHNGDLNRALAILEAAKDAGASAVKIQTYRPDTITIDHSGPDFIVEGGLWHGRTLYQLYEEAHTPWEWHEDIFGKARDLGITVFSSPFDFTAVDLLESLGAPAYKIASPELIDLPLIRRVGETGKPVILSTGMATKDEIGQAVRTAIDAGANGVIVLHCTSSYPTKPADANLATIRDIKETFQVITGLSDHSEGYEIPGFAVSLGADVIEKHFTLDRADAGVDSAFSVNPTELKKLVSFVNMARESFGQPAFEPVKAEGPTFRHRRSLYAVAPIMAGDSFTAKNVRSIRPGNGLEPKYFEQVIGKVASRDISFGEPLDETMLLGGLTK